MFIFSLCWEEEKQTRPQLPNADEKLQPSWKAENGEAKRIPFVRWQSNTYPSSYIISAAKDIQCSGTRTHIIIVRTRSIGLWATGRRQAKQMQLSLEARISMPGQEQHVTTRGRLGTSENCEFHSIIRDFCRANSSQGCVQHVASRNDMPSRVQTRPGHEQDATNPGRTLPAAEGGASRTDASRAERFSATNW